MGSMPTLKMTRTQLLVTRPRTASTSKLLPALSLKLRTNLPMIWMRSPLVKKSGLIMTMRLRKRLQKLTQISPIGMKILIRIQDRGAQQSLDNMEAQPGLDNSSEVKETIDVIRTAITTNSTSLSKLLDILIAELLCAGRVASKSQIKVVFNL